MMKILATILSITCLKANAVTYYVSNAGSDAANGTSTGTSWQTVAKVNASTFAAGDNILFKAGDSWSERLNPPNSGTVGNVITISSYGSGVKPQINLFETATGFNNEGSNVWSKVIPSSSPIQNTVIINGVLGKKARWPNTGYATFIPASSKTNYIKTATLTGTPSCALAECVTRTTAYILDVNRVSSQHIDTLFLSYCTPSPYNTGNQDGLSYDPSTLGTAARTGYFIQNFLAGVDTLYEYYYDSINTKLYVYSATSPTVQFSTKDTGVYINHKNYIKFDGIKFTGINKMALGVDTCDNITIQNCTFDKNGFVSIDGRGSTNVTVDSDSIMNCFSNAIWSERAFKKLIFTNNYIKNTGTVAGMGLSNNQRYMGIWSDGDSCKINNNTIDSTGYIGIYFNGKKDTIYRNYITNYSYIKDDGGAIQCYSTANDGSLIRSNITLNGLGAPITGTTTSEAPGIYIDANSLNVTADSNTVERGAVAGALINSGSTGVVFRDNTIVDSIGFCMYLPSNSGSINSKRNVLYAKLSAQGKGCVIAFNYSGIRVLDTNYYLCPTNEATKLKFGGNVPKTLAEWQALTGWDLQTQTTPSNITAAAGILYTNPATTNRIVGLNGLYIDAKGGLHNGSVTLTAFQSIVLFKANYELRESFVTSPTYKIIQR